MTEFGAAASSSSFTYRWPYHVFLSFRGEDTRQGFTGHLYNALDKRGIRTFLDDEGIRKGEDITPTLLKTIEDSKTAIVVFSKNYASSTFCLTELVQILNCMKGRNGRFIWPVFYDVDPSDIRHQTGSYKDAFDQHERVKDEKIVKLWRLALTEAANMSGWHLELEPRPKTYEYKIMEDIIRVVSKETQTDFLHVAQFPVGLEHRVKEVRALLNIQPHFDGATMIGICGIGGIGKTTIARAVYNEIKNQFQYRCFLSDIKEKSIQYLHKTLLSKTIGEKDIELNHDESGIQIIKDRLHNKKVLLILDDVNTLKQLRAIAGESSWFGSGSIVIITTRDRSLLKNHGIEKKYEVKELIYEKARELLILNAFKNKVANPEYEKVIQRAVKYASGLPLVLEILGSNFRSCETVEEWKTALDVYKKIPDKSVQKILKVSYDGLEETQREIFLDIACFYRGEPLGDATKILSASHGGLEFCIRVLIDKSLIKIDDDGYLDMHDLIQDMGQEIVRQESPIDVGRRSRLWSSKDILHVLKENTGTAKIQALKLLDPFDDEERTAAKNLLYNFDDEKVEWSGEPFEKMKNLRVLSFSSSKKFYQGPKCLPNSLRVVECKYYPQSTLPEDFCPINLVILRLRRSCLKTLGKACKNFNNLRELDLSGSQNLEELPDISKAVDLEVLNVSCCEKLTKIDDSVGRLVKLRVLNVEKCGRLDTFIVGGIKLVSLEILNLSNCSNLHTFPKILVTMEKIKRLNLGHTAIKILPESIEKLVAIKRLWLDDKYSQESNLGELVLEGLEQLSEIRKIAPNIEVFSANSKLLTSSSIKALLKQHFYNLRKLDLQCCQNLKELPDISGVANLEELNVSYCKKLTKIDDSVGYHSKLRLLVVRGCWMLDTFIVRGIKLVSIEIIDLCGCSNLHIFPEILAPIEKIKTLDLSSTAIKTLSKSIENFISLEALYQSGCKKLRQLPNLACLHNLKTIDLNFCSELEEITEIPSNIEVFSVLWCTSRQLSTQEFFNLVILNLGSCENLEELPDISGAANLEELDVRCCPKLTKIDDSVGHLAKLRVLNAHICPMLETFIAGGIKLVSLETLNLRNCDKLHAFPEILGSMENIIRLDLGHTAIKLLPESMEKLVALERLWLSNIKEDLSKDKDLSSERDLFPICMSRLFLDGCEQLQEIRKIPPNIKVLFAENCKSLTSSLVRALLEQELQETRKTEFIMPGNEIPKWLHKHSTGGSVSFWAPRKFPQIALCAVVTGGPTIFISFMMHINGVTKHVVRLGKIEIETDHIFLFDLRHFDKRVTSELLAKEWNHVEFSLEGGGTESRLKYIGVYVYNYDSCMEDILFENPIPQERIQVEAVHKIGDSNLVSSSRANNKEDDKLNKDNMDLSTETVSNIEKKKGQLKVDNVNLTLSLALPEPSSDTSSYHDDKLNKEVMDSFTKVGSSINKKKRKLNVDNVNLTLSLAFLEHSSDITSHHEIMDSSPKAASSIEKKKRKLKMDDENLTFSLALPELSSDTTSHHDLQQQQHLSSISQDILESSGIVKQAKGKDIIVYGGDGNENLTFSLALPELSSDTTSHHELQQQQHLSSIDQDILESSGIVKQAKGKDIIVYGGDANEKKGRNALKVTCQNCLLSSNNEILTWDPMKWEYELTRQKDQSTVMDKGHDAWDPMEWEYQLTRPKD